MNSKTCKPARPLKRELLVMGKIISVMLLFLVVNACRGLETDGDMIEKRASNDVEEDIVHVGDKVDESNNKTTKKHLRKKTTHPSSPSSFVDISSTSTSSSVFDENTDQTRLRRKSISKRLHKLIASNEREEGNAKTTTKKSQDKSMLSGEEEANGRPQPFLSTISAVEVSADGWTRDLKKKTATETDGTGPNVQGWADSKRGDSAESYPSKLPQLFRDNNDSGKRSDGIDEPSMLPTDAPSSQPSKTPSTAPTIAPSISVEPSYSSHPSSSPSTSNSPSSSTMPSDAPSLVPSDVPSTMPSSNAPSVNPATTLDMVVEERDKLKTQKIINEKEAQLTRIYSNIRRSDNRGPSGEGNSVSERENLVRRGVVQNNIRQDGYGIEDIIRDREYLLHLPGYSN